MKIKGAIFDLDGTLIDSMSVWVNIVTDYLGGKYNIEPDPVFVRDMRKIGSSIGLCKELSAKYLPGSTPEEILEEINEGVRFKYENELSAKHGVKPFLFAMKCKGVRMCVATLTRRSLAEAALKRLGMLDYFCAVLSCEDYGIGKTSPEIYLKAHEILSTPFEDTYVFEDSLYSVKTAKEAGFKVVGVNDFHSEKHKDEIKRISDVYINDYDDFRGMI